MEHAYHLRLAQPGDASQIAGIYDHYAKETAITFDYDSPTAGEFSERIVQNSRMYPWLVVEQDGFILGYAYGSMHRTKTAYQWSPESTIYVAPTRHGKRLGRILYETLFALLKMQGYVNVYAGVTVPNEKSEGLHATLGFERIGDFKNVGYKQGKWHDVRWLVLHLTEHGSNPSTPLPMESIIGTDEYRHILAKANDALNQNHRL